MEKLVILAVVIFALLIATGPVTEPAAQAARQERPSTARAALAEPVTLEGVEDKGQPEVLPVRSSLRRGAAQQTCPCTVCLGLPAQGAPRTLSSLVTFLLRTTADAVRHLSAPE